MSLKDTINKKEISQEEVKKIFNGNEEQAAQKNGKRVIKIKSSEQVVKKRRPTFELEEQDYQKLKAVCAFEGNDIGKTITKIVKDWLDDIELVV